MLEALESAGIDMIFDGRLPSHGAVFKSVL
jgi:hypothetical protein